MIFYIMGKSASGKDSVYKCLLEKDASLNKVNIYTTRPKRENELEGIEYHFVDENFLKENASKIIEKRVYHTVFGDWYYATLDDGYIKSDKNYIMIGTLESYNSLKEYYGEDKVYPIFLEVDNEERKKRAINRENPNNKKGLEELERRFVADEVDFSEENINKASIKKRYKNNDFQTCITDIINDINKYKANND